MLTIDGNAALAIVRKRRQLIVGFLSLLALCPLLRGSDESHTSRFPDHASISISAADLQGDHSWVRLIDFAISPDDTRMVFEFVAGDAGDTAAIWVAQYEIATKKVIGQIKLSDTKAPDFGFEANYHLMIQYIPDGSGIIVQSPEGVYHVDSVGQGLLRALSYPLPPDFSTSGPADRLFSISANAGRLAVLVGQAFDPPKLGSIYVYATDTEQEVSHWRSVWRIQSLAVSPDGKELLETVSDSSDTGDILLLDSQTGKVLRAFRSGFGAEQSARIKSVFIDSDHFVVVPDGSIDAKGHYLGTALKIFDVRSGEFTRELTYAKWGPGGEVWVSSKDSTIATIDLWMSRVHRQFNLSESGPRKANIIFFHADRPAAPCVFGPVPESREHPIQSGFIRFSPDLQLIGIFENGRATVYTTASCTDHG